MGCWQRELLEAPNGNHRELVVIVVRVLRVVVYYIILHIQKSLWNIEISTLHMYIFCICLFCILCIFFLSPLVPPIFPLFHLLLGNFIDAISCSYINSHIWHEIWKLLMRVSFNVCDFEIVIINTVISTYIHFSKCNLHFLIISGQEICVCVCVCLCNLQYICNYALLIK